MAPTYTARQFRGIALLVPPLIAPQLVEIYVNINIGTLMIVKGLRPVLEGFVVTMHEGACEQEVKSRGSYAEGFVALFAQARQTPRDRP